MSTSGFEGFPHDLPKFLKALQRNNKKEWFDAHRAEYEAAYVEPAKRFVEALATPLGKIAPNVLVEPRINGSIMRVNRDTRFSKDRRPYKDALHFVFAEGDHRHGAGFYLRFAPKELAIAGGAFGFNPDQLKRFRNAVLDPKLGKSLRAAVRKVEKAGLDLSEPDLKKVPRGFDADHPNAQYLRYKGFWAHTSGPVPDEIYGPKAVEFVAKKFRELRPVQKWVADVLA